jgi:hypothetical protein
MCRRPPTVAVPALLCRSLLSEVRKQPKSEKRSAKMICDQVEKEFKARKTEVTLSANTINRYVSEGKKEKV